MKLIHVIMTPLFVVVTTALFIADHTAMTAQVSASADTVLRYSFGSGQTNGQGPAFFPRNVLGLPDPTATDTTPSTDPREICSLGLGGSITLGFKDRVVVDGPGVDLTVFENAFRYGKSRVYAEPAVVAVSKDGEAWVEFPYDPVSLAGCAGVTPTTGDDPFDPSVSGGDGFDLAAIGMDSIRWVRITDISEVILKDSKHPYYDPTLTGADIDAVVGVHIAEAPFQTSMMVVPRSTTLQITVRRGSGTLLIHDVSGRLLSEETLGPGIHGRDVSSLVVTVALATLVADGEVVTVKVLR